MAEVYVFEAPPTPSRPNWGWTTLVVGKEDIRRRFGDDERIAAVLADEIAWAATVPEDAMGCTCDGSGLYYGAGIVENGVFKGYTGVHYECEGKGWTNEEDRKRNAYYWAHIARISA